MAAGSMDAISFSRLGNVFTSVMTGNLVLFGVAIGRMDRVLAAHVAVSVVTFATGVFLGSRLAGPPPKGLEGWRREVTHAIVAELLVLAAFAVAWEFVIASPRSGAIPFAAISTAALAMGIQSGAIRAVGDPGLSTTYLTGTLTGAMGLLATDRRLPLRNAALLMALLVGAAIEGVLVVFVPQASPVLPLGLVAAVVAVATWFRIDQLEARA
jgi:uncharacterized membrane protein YoaK (UPF0700 family)